MQISPYFSYVIHQHQFDQHAAFQNFKGIQEEILKNFLQLLKQQAFMPDKL